MLDKFRMLLVEAGGGGITPLDGRLSRLLGDGSKLLHAASTDEAAEIFREQSADVIVIDLQEPSHPAAAVIREIREYTACTPLVAVVGADNLDLRREATEAGADIFATLEDVISPGRLEGLVVEAAARGRWRSILCGQAEEEHAEFEALFMHVPGAVFLLDDERRIRRINIAAEKLLGKKAEQLEGLACSEVLYSMGINSESRVGVSGKAEECLIDRLIRNAIKNGASYHREETVVQIDGPDGARDLNLLVSISPVDIGRKRFVIACAEDVTELRRTRHELHDTELELLNARKMEAITRLAGGIAHDFNNLLGAIIGASDILLRNPSDPSSVTRHVKMIREVAERATSLTTQLLAYSHRQILHPKVLNINTVVARIARMLRPVIHEDIELVTEFDPTVDVIKIDPAQIEQLVMNLVLNAQAAMPTGGRLLLKTTDIMVGMAEEHSKLEIAPGRYTVLYVADTGAGLAGDKLSHVFEPYYADTGEDGVAGLRLSTVYNIARQNNGAVAVDSRPAEGTTFKIYLPIWKDDVERIGTGEATDDANIRLLQSQPRNETILLVEDEPAMKLVIREVLAKEGYKILEAANGSEALLLVKSYDEKIDLVLTDVVMPQMGGRTLVERLSVLKPEIKVLYMSGYTDDEVLRHGVKVSEISFIAKPFTVDDLSLKIRMCLSEKE